jgi:WD40 repeat protein
LAVGGDAGKVSLWDVAERTQLRATNVGRAPVFAVKFSPDGKKLAVSDGTTGIRILAVTDLSQETELRDRDGVVVALAFSSDGSRLASAIAISETGAVDVWSMPDHSSRRLVEISGRAVTDVAFSDSDVLSAQVLNMNTLVWLDGMDRKPMAINSVGDVSRHAKCLAFSPDGSRLAVAGRRELRVINVRTQRQDSVKIRDSNEDEGPFGIQDEIQDIAFSPDGLFLATAVKHSTQTVVRPHIDGSVQVWAVGPLRYVRSFSSPHCSMSEVEFLPRGDALVAASIKGQIHVWPLESPP